MRWSPRGTHYNLMLLIASMTFVNMAVAQDWPRYTDRNALGKSDAVDVTLPVGRIIVIGTSIAQVGLTIQRIPAGRDLPFFPDTTAILTFPFYQGPYQSTLSDKGLSLRFPFPTNWTPDSVSSSLDRQIGQYLNGKLNYSYSDTKNGQNSFLNYFESIIAGKPVAKSDSIYGLEVRLLVPRNLAHLNLNILGAGSVIVQDFDGELVITSNKGPVYLGHIGGSALVEANDGDITASVAQAIPGKPISLMSAKGQVGLWIPSTAMTSLTISPRGGRLITQPAALFPQPVTDGATLFFGDKDARGAYGTVRLNTLAGNIYYEQVKGDLPRWPKPPN